MKKLGRVGKLVTDPIFLMKCLTAILILFTFLKNSDYSINWDSYAQDQYGARTLHWYLSAGKDKSFLALGNIAQHGPFVELVENGAKRISPQNGWYIRNVITGLLAIAGFIAIFLCGMELDLPWVGLLAVCILIFMPRFFGDMFVNSKDIPFASSMTFILWSILHLLKNWNKSVLKESLIIGIALGLANVIRITSIATYAFLLLIAIIYGLYRYRMNNSVSFKTEIKKEGISALIIFVSSYFLTIVLWPYVFLSPIKNLVLAIQVMSKFPWDGMQLFAGTYMHATNFPRLYIPIWLLISTPIITLLLFLAGSIIGINASRESKKDLLGIGIIIAYFFFLLLGLIVLKPNLSDAIRQVLFLLPPIALIASYGLYKLIQFAQVKKNSIAKAFIIIITIIGYSLTAIAMINLHPYEQVYFNSFVGRLHGAYNKYETDYYGICLKEANTWLGAHYKTFTTDLHPSIRIQADPEQYLIYLPTNFVLKTSGNADFYMLVEPSKYHNKDGGTKIIYTVQRDNVPLCQIWQ